MNELAQAFFHEYRQRLANGLPQQTNPARKTLLERAVEAYQHGDLTETAAIEQVEREGCSDVVPRFHTVNRDPIPLRFYEATPKGLVLTDALLATVRGVSRKRCTPRQPVDGISLKRPSPCIYRWKCLAPTSTCFTARQATSESTLPVRIRSRVAIRRACASLAKNQAQGNPSMSIR